jgi:hypothetical protein
MISANDRLNAKEGRPDETAETRHAFRRGGARRLQRDARLDGRLDHAGRRQRQGDGELRPHRQLELARRRQRAGRRQEPGHDANSGIFARCADPKKISDETCYEANIFDQRPDPTFGTGAIVKVAKIANMPKAGGKWNTYEFTMDGTKLTVVLNGQKTVEVNDAKLASGPFALQHGSGVIKWRNVAVRSLVMGM